MHDELTKVDIKKMQEEINYRKFELMPKLKEDLRHARELGDLSENFEYRAAKRELGRNNSRIHYLETMIATAKVIDVKSADGVVGLFDKIKLYDEDGEEEMDIVLVTTLRQNSLEGYISKESPLGKAIMGKKVGDRFTVQVDEHYSYEAEIRSIKKSKDDGSVPLLGY